MKANIFMIKKKVFLNNISLVLELFTKQFINVKDVDTNRINTYMRYKNGLKRLSKKELDSISHSLTISI